MARRARVIHKKMKRLHDIVVPLVTPLREDDTIDVASLENLTNYLIDRGVDGLYPCGSTGEMVYLTNEERKLVVETVVRAAKGRVEVFAQVGAANTRDTIELAQHAVSCGADGIGVVTPWYFGISQNALADYYQQVSRSVPGDFPVYLYCIPQNAVNDLLPDTVRQIAGSCKNVVGIKYSFADMTRLQQYITAVSGDFGVLVGPDHLYVMAAAVGATGTVSGNAQILPRYYTAMRDAMAANDWKKAAQLQHATNILNSILCKENNIGCYKAVLKEQRVIACARMRSPMEDVSAEKTQALLHALRAAGYTDLPQH